MTKVELASILGWIATFLFTVCYIPQIVKTYRTRTVEGVSFRSFAFLSRFCISAREKNSGLTIINVGSLFCLAIMGEV